MFHLNTGTTRKTWVTRPTRTASKSMSLVAGIVINFFNHLVASQSKLVFFCQGIKGVAGSRGRVGIRGEMVCNASRPCCSAGLFKNNFDWLFHY